MCPGPAQTGVRSDPASASNAAPNTPTGPEAQRDGLDEAARRVRRGGCAPSARPVRLAGMMSATRPTPIAPKSWRESGSSVLAAPASMASR